MAMTVSYSVVPRKNPAKRVNRQSTMRKRKHRVNWILKSYVRRLRVVPLVRRQMCVLLFQVFFMR